MKIIITEEQSSFLRRRFGVIDDLVKHVLYNFSFRYFNQNWTLEDFRIELSWQIYDLLYEEGHDVDKFGTDSLFEYIEKTYKQEIKSKYNKLKKEKDL